MDELDQSSQSPLFGLTIDQSGRGHLLEASKWAKFLAIVGFVGCGLVVCFGIFMALNFENLQRRSYSDTPIFPGFGAFVGFAYIIGAVLYFFPCLFLLRFSNKMKAALASDDQEHLTSSFQNLKILYRYKGILTIIALAIYLLAFLFVGLGLLIR